ncbi:uncharacterized protein LOC108250845 [Kryptolebias marmoratus]|uniref:uncharacterized protein LOC108250845 n=1 Tax=Kryptolebias marmoratus TaxID=37003 RepID=UPI0007F88794|nr:uncharacterized protein LOC108250845 [Kryptolebias marmoratus]
MTLRMSCLLFLPLLGALTAAAQPVNNTGMNFTVVFPENIAYYHPRSAHNRIWVTALLDDTTVTFTKPSGDVTSPALSAGEMTNIFTSLELKKNLSSEAFKVSSETFRVTSDKPIVVQAVTEKRKSVQTTLAVPADKLGMKYFIPPVPEIAGTTDEPDLNVTEKDPFRLIIFNPDENNEVTVKGPTDNSVVLQPGQVAQSWVPKDQKARVVQADKPFAVFFSHPCAMQTNCTCGLLSAMLPPARNQTVRFPIPSVLAEKAQILLSDEGTHDIKTFNPDSAVVESSGTVILYRPGLFLTLIPETEFAGCFLIPFVSITNTKFAIIVVLKTSTNGIHIGNEALGTQEWQDLKGTEYVSTNYTLTSNNTLIWHNSSKMAVYFVGYEGLAWFGTPAPIISSTPDYRGCLMKPEKLAVLQEAEGWRESLQSCENTGFDLISFSDTRLHEQVCNKLLPDGEQNLWIGLRRSSKSGDWYWLSGDPVNSTSWDSGEPGEVEEGQCALMSLGTSCTWRDEDCCNTHRPLCYTEPSFFNGLNN